MAYDFGVNQALVEELYLRYRENPAAVSAEWRKYFDGLDRDVGMMPAPSATTAHASAAAAPPAAKAPPMKMGGRNASGVFSLPPTAEVVPPFGTMATIPPSADMQAAVELQARVSAMVNAYRVRGHLFAQLDPLGMQDQLPFDLSLETFGLHKVDPETIFAYGNKKLSLREIVQRLKDTYCRTIGVEFTFIEDPEERRWLQHRMEDTCNHTELDRETQVRILGKLTDAETFERFLHSTYIGAKRFSVEGGESVIPMLELIIDHAAPLGVEEIVIGMAHRGRLNVLINVLELPPHDILAAFEDNDPERYLGSGDVKYHLGHSTDRFIDGRKVHLTLSFNPSHLEFVNPVVEGRVRAKQDRKGDAERSRVMPLLIHGDAAFIGQGVVAETLNLAGLRAYDTGGTMHVVVNNQIGFTTAIRDARSTRYCTDITRMLRCPVFHVNGEDPEAVVHVARIAAEYRQRYRRDVVLDLYCYRKYGHNEGDEPRFTQPLMYEAIDAKTSVREVYIDRLVDTGQMTREEAEETRERIRAILQSIPVGVLVYDPSQRIEFWNDAYSQYSGFPVEVLEKKPSFEAYSEYVFHTHNRGRDMSLDRFMAYRRRVYGSDEKYLAEFHFDLTGLDVQYSVSPLPAGGRVNVIVDITQQKQAERTALEAIVELPRRDAVTFVLTDDDGLVTPLKAAVGHVPEEVTTTLAKLSSIEAPSAWASRNTARPSIARSMRAPSRFAPSTAATGTMRSSIVRRRRPALRWIAPAPRSSCGSCAGARAGASVKKRIS